ncbi:MAG: chemotaxis protein CheW [Myxococcota bacterium]
MSRPAQLCTFTVADTLLGLEVEHVQEVLRFHEMARVPLASETIEGLINLRGQIVTAIDMRRRFSLPPRVEDQRPMNVVLSPSHGSVSLLVDDIGDVLDLDDQEMESPPATLDPAFQDLIRGVYKLDGRLLLMLDPVKAIDLAPMETA